MSQRERHAPHGVATMPPPADQPANGMRASPEPLIPDSLIWETLFPLLPPAEQSLLMGRPEPSANGRNGHSSAEPHSREPFREATQRILSRDPPDVEPLPFVEPVDLFDADLDSAQADAVCRSLHGADLLLIQGLPGTGKSRTIVELIRQATPRGLRVLLTAPTGAAVDAILSRLTAAAEIEFIRCLARDEDLSAIPEFSARCTANNRETAVREMIIARAREREVELASQLQNLRDLAPIWTELAELGRQREILEQERTALINRRDSAERDIRREAESARESARSDSWLDDFRRQCQSHADWMAAWEAQHTELQKERVRLEEQCQCARERCDVLRPMEEAARSGRFWTLRFWKARFDTSLPVRVTNAQRDVEVCEEALQSLQHREEKHKQDRLEAETAHTTACERMMSAAADARRLEIDRRIAALDRETAHIDELAVQRLDRLPADIERPAVLSLESARSAEAKHYQRIEALGEAHHAAIRWRSFAETESEQLSRRWRSSVRCVAGPISALGNDPWFARDDASFDLVIVAHAHNLSENELMQAGRRGKRWILFGEPPLPVPPPSRSYRNGTRPLSARRARSPDFFARLWERLYQRTWQRDSERLFCRLHQVPAADRERVESEAVADRPEVELRIWNRRNAEPILAEVRFPASMSLCEAKQYLFRELGEIPCHSRYRIGRWDRDGDSLLFRLGQASPDALNSHCVALTDGVSLRQSDRCDDNEIAVVFSGQAGWDRQKAEAWIRKHLQPRDNGRACRLERRYRHSPPLAAWLDVALFGPQAQSMDPACEGAIDFIPVPRRMPIHARHRGGAGIEIDLSIADQRAQLPAELVATLPDHGYVNLAEARAVGELLTRLPRDHRVAIAAPYGAQTALLRHFCPGAFVVAAEDFAHVECDVLVLSLTRSHVSRAVTYGDDPLTMLRMLPTARCRILFVGDPGTLARRAQWEGAIDHLDETDGERERRWVKAVLPWLPARISQPQARVPQNV